MELTGPHRNSGSKIRYKYCPSCGRSDWATSLDPDTGFWICFGCGRSGKEQTDLDLSNPASALRARQAGKASTSRHTWPDMDLPAWEPLSKSASRYLAQRGIDKTLAAQLGIVERPDMYHVLVPFLGPAGRIIYWTSRAYSKFANGPKYDNPDTEHPLYVLPMWQQVKSLYVVEGTFDAIAVWAVLQQPVVALGGKTLTRRLEHDILELAEEQVTLLLDGGAGHAAIKIRNKLYARRDVRILRLRGKDDPSSLGPELKEWV